MIAGQQNPVAVCSYNPLDFTSVLSPKATDPLYFFPSGILRRNSETEAISFGASQSKHPRTSSSILFFTLSTWPFVICRHFAAFPLLYSSCRSAVRASPRQLSSCENSVKACCPPLTKNFRGITMEYSISIHYKEGLCNAAILHFCINPPCGRKRAGCRLCNEKRKQYA